MINRVLGGKAIVLIRESNQPHIQKVIATNSYTHVFTSPEKALSKNSKKTILDSLEFTDRLCLIAIDKIHLAEEWCKEFRPFCANISKVRKRIPFHIFTRKLWRSDGLEKPPVEQEVDPMKKAKNAETPEKKRENILGVSAELLLSL